MRKEKSCDTVIRKDIMEDDGNQYIYELTLRQGARTANYKIPLYSIKVSMNTSEGRSTSASIKDVFSDVGAAVRFYDRIVKGLATPIDLRYIAEDEMG